MNQNFIIKILIFTILLLKTSAKSIIFANYYNVILYYPSEFGGNDDIRIVFDVRNVTTGTFKYTPIIVDVAYDSQQNIAYCYLESAIRSYIILLKWFGGKWCYQIMFEFDSSTYSNYMYHSLVTLDNFVYWTSAQYVMSGRIPGYEMRRLMQPGWERIYRMTIDKPNKQLYVASFDFGENVIYGCSILRYSCVKLTTTNFAINSIFFDSQEKQLYVGSIQVQNLYRYSEQTKTIVPLNNVKTSVSDMAIINDNFGVFTNRESISVCKDIRLANCIRLANPRLVDPYTLQYVFTFDHVSDFSNYPYPYSSFQDILWKDKQYLFHLHILGIDYVENDYAFLPEMDLNNNFLRVDSCVNIFFDTRMKILVPALIAAGAVLIVFIIAILICICKSKRCGCFKKKKETKITVATGSAVPLQSSIKKNKKQMMPRIYNNDLPIINSSSSQLYDPRRTDGNKTHSSGIYIMGKNNNNNNIKNQQQQQYSYADSEVSNTTESYLNPKYATKLQSRPIDRYRPENRLPVSVDSKRVNYITDPQRKITIGNYQIKKQQQQQTSPSKTRYVSSCHIPLYGSANTKNYINIKKAVEFQNSYNYPSLSDENDSYNMVLM
jgi:hypothetical protein